MLPLGERHRPTAFDGTNRFIENAWWTKDGRIEAQVRPGTYDLVVTRGPEYEIATESITLEPGKFVAKQVQLVRGVQTDGWVAGDFHIHAAPSTDSGLPIDKRVISCAAEGLEVAVATDHNFITDYSRCAAWGGLWLLGIACWSDDVEWALQRLSPVERSSHAAASSCGLASRRRPDQLRRSRARSRARHRPDQPSAAGGARLLRAVLHRRRDRRAVHADRSARRVRALR
jgi:hypothetical protein